MRIKLFPPVSVGFNETSFSGLFCSSCIFTVLLRPVPMSVYPTRRFAVFLGPACLAHGFRLAP